MSLRRKILFKDAVVLIGLLLMIAAALRGLQQQRAHVRASLDEYAALHLVESAESHLTAFQQKVHAGQGNTPAAVDELAAASLAIRQYKAVVMQYDSVLPKEITSDLQNDVRNQTGTIVNGVVQLSSMVNRRSQTPVLRFSEGPGSAASGPALRRTSEPAFSDGKISSSVDTLSTQLVDLLGMCNGFVHRTQLQSDSDLRSATITVSSIAIATLLLTAAASVWQYRRISTPLERLRAWCRSTVEAGFSLPYAPTSDREFQDLARDVNRMASDLSAFHRKLESMVETKSRELVRSERLASVGYLAAGVAHEINSPLNIMSGYAELSLKRLARAEPANADEQLVQNLSIIRGEAFRCKEITQKLLSLARGDSGAHETVQVDELAADVATMVRGINIARNKTLELDLEPSLSVSASPTEIKQVLLNLLVNAIEAVPTGTGVVTVTGAVVGDAVELAVTDNGRGMDEPTRERVFEPFFTNKRGAGEPGTGLGLSITHAIVTHHGGSIRADSDGPGRGSRFTVRLPAMAASELNLVASV